MDFLKVAINLWLGFHMLVGFDKPKGKWTLITLFAHVINIYWLYFVPINVLYNGMSVEKKKQPLVLPLTCMKILKYRVKIATV